MENLKKLMQYQYMFVHDLRDADEIDNAEEKEFIELIKKAKIEIEETQKELQSVHETADVLFRSQEDIILSVCNALGIEYELSSREEILKEISLLKSTIEEYKNFFKKLNDWLNSKGAIEPNSKAHSEIVGFIIK